MVSHLTLCRSQVQKYMNLKRQQSAHKFKILPSILFVISSTGLVFLIEGLLVSL